MFAVVKEVSTLSGTPMTYVLIHIWATKSAFTRGDEPTGDNAFVMDLYTTDQRVVTDETGRYKTQDGRFIRSSQAGKNDLWELETFKVDVPVEIQRNIEGYLDRRRAAEGTDHEFPAFHARPAMARTEDDPRGILAMSDVQALVGKGVLAK